MQLLTWYIFVWIVSHNYSEEVLCLVAFVGCCGRSRESGWRNRENVKHKWTN